MSENTVTNEYLTEVQQRAQEAHERALKATPGQWKLWLMDVYADQDGTSNVDTATRVARTYYEDANGKPRTNNAEFIAKAHADVPALAKDAIVLVDEVRRLRDCVKRLISERDAFQMATEEGSEIAACLTAERDEASAEVARLRARDAEWQRVTQCADPDAFPMAVCGGPR